MLAFAHHHRLAAGYRTLALAALACLPLAACGSDDGGAHTVRSREGTAGNVTTDTGVPPTVPPVVTTPDSSVAADIVTVVYQYHDAAVAPEYHRSYTVTVTEGSATVVVDAYGDVMAQDTQPIDAAAWALTVDGAAALAGTPSQENNGCTGGTADELTALDAAGAEVVHVFVDHCDQAGGPNVVSVVSSVLPLFDLEAMIATETE